MSQEIPKVYNPADVEQKWYKIWEESGVFKPEENSPKEPFTIVIPPPNVTGSLHMGHALDNGIQDLLIRYKKMQGFNTLWIPGTDHAGIATQNVVEKALRKEGTSKDKLGREEFLKRVWQWKEEYGGRITGQLRRLGCALDWSRERFTMDEGLSKAVTKEFVTLYNEGLIYKGKRLINWCPRCGTAISDIEVEHETKKGKLWYLKYQVDGMRDEGEGVGYVVVATTRPETMLGDTAVAVNPKDKRYKKLVGKMIELPLTDRKIPIIADDFVDQEFGTGAVKVTPAHDPNDFEIGERHDLPRINILTPDGKITVGEFNGLDRFEARKKIVEKLEEQGLIEKIEDYENSVGQCYRCKTVIEPYLSDQWYVKVADLAREAIKVVEEGKISYVPERWTKIYINWMTNLKDWCISRQLWWGHRIPAWYCREITNYKLQITNDGNNYCNEIIVSEETPTKCPKCGGTKLEQDPDVFDTWFSSALWPFSTLGWPDKTKELETFYPTSVLVTGYDIITFWVSRMIMMGTHFMKKVPFSTVFIHGLVRDASGKKMSKSFGNVIDPLEIIDKVGADALRFALISLITGQGQDIKLTPDKITEARNFANKIWNVARFVMQASELMVPDNKIVGSLKLELADKWILSRYNSLINNVTKSLDTFEFGEAARAIYDFLWGDFCDWYVEISKKDLYSDDAKQKEKVQSVLLYVLAGSLKLLHPFMPFITKEINEKLRMKNEECRYLLLDKWPKGDKKLIDPKIEKQMELIKEVIVKVRNIKAEMGVQTKDIELIFVAKDKAELETLKAGEAFIKSLAKAASIEFKSSIKTKPEQAATGVVADIQFFIPLAGLIDFEKEKDRLKKEEEKLEAEIKRLDSLLANKNFTAKAPPETIDKQKEALKAAKEKLIIVKARIKDLV
ncbi:MAG: valine--tRNA ligase [bacterium]